MTQFKNDNGTAKNLGRPFILFSREAMDLRRYPGYLVCVKDENGGEGKNKGITSSKIKFKEITLNKTHWTVMSSLCQSGRELFLCN